MNLRELTPEESAVLDAIIEQRINSFGYIFKYDFKEAQEYLNRNGAAKKYLITAMRQMEIAIKLMIDQVIDADCLVNMDFVNNYRSVIDPNYIPNKSLPKFFWLNDTDWARENSEMNGLRSIEEVDAEDGGEMFVRMTEDDIQRIKDSRKNQKVYLKLDTERLTLLIRTDGEENWKIISKLKDDCLPFKVLKCAYKHCGKKITREMLKKSGVDVQNKYLRAQVFSDNEAVKTLVPELLEIDKDTIIFRTEAILTPRKLKKLQKLSKI